MNGSGDGFVHQENRKRGATARLSIKPFSVNGITAINENLRNPTDCFVANSARQKSDSFAELGRRVDIVETLETLSAH